MGAGVVIGLCLSGEGEECVRDAASASECNSAERYGKCGDDARAHHDGLCGDAARVEQLHDHNLQRVVDEVEGDRVTADVLQEAGHGGFLASVERASDAPREEHGSCDSGEDDRNPEKLEALDGAGDVGAWLVAAAEGQAVLLQHQERREHGAADEQHHHGRRGVEAAQRVPVLRDEVAGEEEPAVVAEVEERADGRGRTQHPERDRNEREPRSPDASEQGSGDVVGEQAEDEPQPATGGPAVWAHPLCRVLGGDPEDDEPDHVWPGEGAELAGLVAAGRFGEREEEEEAGEQHER